MESSLPSNSSKNLLPNNVIQQQSFSTLPNVSEPLHFNKSSPLQNQQFVMLKQFNFSNNSFNHQNAQLSSTRKRSVAAAGSKKPKQFVFPKTNDDFVNPAYNNKNDIDEQTILFDAHFNQNQISKTFTTITSPLIQKSYNKNINETSHANDLKLEKEDTSNKGKEPTKKCTYSEEPFNRAKSAPEEDDDETAESKWVGLSIQWLKMVVILITFLAVLLFAVFSKITILLMTSMVAADHSVAICNSEKSFLVTEPLQHDKLYRVQYDESGGYRSRIAWLWCLTFALVSPYVFSWVRALRIVYFKSSEVCRFSTFVTVFVFETLHCIGQSLLAYFLLPQVDVLKGTMMMNSVAMFPGLLRLFVVAGKVQTKENMTKTKPNSRELFWGMTVNKVVAGSSALAQLISIGLWTAIGYSERQQTGGFTHWYLIPAALILASFEWWENYLVPERMHHCLAVLISARNDLADKVRSRYFVALFTMPWKVALTGGMMIFSQYFQNFEVGALFHNFTASFHTPTVPVTRVKGMEGSVLLDSEHHILYINFVFWPVITLVGHIIFTYLCYAFAKFTCKVGIHEISFAIPVTITVPVTVSLFWALKSLEIEDKCQLTSLFAPFQYIFWRMGNLATLGASFTYPSESDGGHEWLNVAIVLGLWLMLGLASQVALTQHIWSREINERLAPTEHLFLAPMYNALLLDQSLAMNRRTTKVAIFDPAKEQVKMTKAEKAAWAMKAAKLKTEEEQLKKQKQVAAQTKNKEEEVTLEVFSHSNTANSDESKFEENSPELVNLHLDNQDDWLKFCQDNGYDADAIDPRTPVSTFEMDETVRIYACTTMWHETWSEMLQTLKSIFRLDIDQWALAQKRKKLGPEATPSYYQMEANIFMDDAFEQGPAKYDRVVNKYVHQLIKALPVAANHVHWQSEEPIKLETPTLVTTPYGGRLIWRLSWSGNRLVAHLKDSKRIRHRKRWSQCMYLYYLLSYRLWSRDDLSEPQRRTISNNTFVLALDGDINFRPVAVHMVVDLMKRNGKLGAVCGRIHPVGSGPIVWYQRFEYSIGHWLQKATEHVFGCVLCSPGCFSLFRARALMDDSVMHRYTTKPSEAIHYVQYDQGEDRWLCTLMLQRGWRIEYCSASDSYTHAPEGFGEIFIQRRRWAPSTMANILDLLVNYKRTVARNENISLLYIAYQGFLMVGTLLSPGTIFLMVVSAMNSALNLDARISLLCNIVAVVAFTVVCLKSKSNDLKINLAMFLSLIYALLMVAVLAGIIIDAYKEGSIFSPNSLFFSAMMASFLLAAVLHPREFACVLPLPLYMLLIPSMYMLLTIYSVTNMNIVSWGTRENETEEKKEDEKGQNDETKPAANKKAKEQNKKKDEDKKSLLQQYFNASKKYSSASKGGLITCVCCCSGGTDEKDAISGQHECCASADEVAKNVAEIKILFEKVAKGESLTFCVPDATDGSIAAKVSNEKNKDVEGQDSNQKTTDYWNIEAEKNEKLNFDEIKLHTREKAFWQMMLTEYLHPLEKDVREEKRISLALAELRNRAVFAFAFLNIIFILFVFILQLHKDVFGVDIPIGIAGYNRTFIEEENVWQVETLWLKTRMDPITLCLVVFFGAILVIQLIGMLIHRFGTLTQLLAYTKLTFCSKKCDEDEMNQKKKPKNEKSNEDSSDENQTTDPQMNVQKFDSGSFNEHLANEHINLSDCETSL